MQPAVVVYEKEQGRRRRRASARASRVALVFERTVCKRTRVQAAAGERARITAAGGFISDVGGVSRVNGNLNLSRAIGDLKYKGNQQLLPADQIITAQPDIVKMELTPADRFFLLACDGVWDVMSNQARRASYELDYCYGPWLRLCAGAAHG